MMCEFLAELCELFLPVLLLALILVHLAEDGIFLIGLKVERQQCLTTGNDRCQRVHTST